MQILLDPPGDDAGPHRVTFRVTVPAAAGRQADVFVRAHARRPLENVLAGLVDDLARVAGQPDTWEHRYMAGWLARQAWRLPPAEENL